MHERHDRGGPSLLPFLLIPATVMVVKAMHRHRAMHGHGWGPSAFGPGRGHRAWGGSPWAGAPDADGGTGPEGQPGFRLPPRIESYLNAWHEQAHEASEAHKAGETGAGPAA